MREGTMQRAIFDYITDKRLKWLPIPAPFERFIYWDYLK